MPREEPFFRKCCFCIPLKSCLHVWSSIKSIADLSLATFLILMVILLDGYHELNTDHFTLAHAFLISIILLIVDSTFMLLLFIGVCTNNLRTLRIFFYYSIYMVFMGCACFIGYLCYAIFDIIREPSGNALVIILLLCGLMNTALDICIIFTLKSEMIKLRNKQQFEFVQMPSLNHEDEEAKESEPFQTDDDNLEV